MRVEIDERAAFLLGFELVALSALGEGRIMGLSSCTRIEFGPGVWVGNRVSVGGRIVDEWLVLTHSEGKDRPAANAEAHVETS